MSEYGDMVSACPVIFLAHWLVKREFVKGD